MLKICITSRQKINIIQKFASSKADVVAHLN